MRFYEGCLRSKGLWNSAFRAGGDLGTFDKGFVRVLRVL